MKKVFFILLILCQQVVWSQCTVTSSNGDYSVTIQMSPAELIAPNSCPNGYNFNVAIDYLITFSGTPPSNALNTLQATLTCGSLGSFFFGLPNGGGSGRVLTANSYNNNTDCATATPTSLNCAIVTLQIAGNGISSRFINCPITALPIELVSFNADLIDGKTLLTWQTVAEINNDFFTVERSIDAINWEHLIDIDGAGNSSQLLDYTTSDLSPYDGTSYYRLKQTDFDGEYSYSEVIAINNIKKGHSGITVYPNPTENLIYIKGNDDELSILNLYSVLGQNISKKVTINTEIENAYIDVSNLSKGMYILKTKSNTVKFYRK